MKRYAGVGSKNTPFNVLRVMEDFAQQAATCEWTLLSGGAPGADSAFERGCNAAGGTKEIYLPWKGFNGHPSHLHTPPEQAFVVASAIHPVYNKLSPSVRCLIARDVQQVLGEDLLHPVLFVVCWTPDGAESIEQYGRGTGGTGVTIALASCLNIPVFNLYNSDRYNTAIQTLTETSTLV